jgi:hypothetical protein
MLNISQYARNNPIAFRLLGMIVVCSSLITLCAILIQLYGSFNDDLSALEKRLDQVRISTLASITKSLWGFDQEQLDIQVNSVLDVEDVVQVTVEWRDWNNTEQSLSASNHQFTPEEISTKKNQFLIKKYPLVYKDASTPEQTLGTLTVTASLESIYGKLRERALFIGLVINIVYYFMANSCVANATHGNDCALCSTLKFRQHRKRFKVKTRQSRCGSG